jgi:hypothetical protein
MALELTRKGGNNKNPKPQINILPKIEEFFQKNPIMKIVVPVICFVILVTVFLLIVFGDKVLIEASYNAYKIMAGIIARDSL